MTPTSRAAGIILRKELVEALRDRKTLVVMLVLPMVMYPLVFLGFSQATMAQRERLAREVLPLGLEGTPPADLAHLVAAAPSATVVPVEDAAEAVRRGDVAAAAALPDDAAARLASNGQLEVRVVFDGSSDRSREAESRLRDALDAFAKQTRAERLRARDLPPDFADPVRLEAENIAPPERQGGWLLGQFLPMLVSFLMIGAAFYPAIDLTAGEKERGTLQTLLTAPIPAVAIVAGKFLAVVSLSLLTGLVNLASVGLVVLSLPLPDELASEFDFAIGPATLLLVLLCLVLLGMMFGAVMMAVAVTTRSFKDAQNWLTPLYLLCVFPLMLSSLPGVALDPSTAAMPVVNVALAMKALLLGEAPPGLLLVVVVSTLAWTALGIVLAARMFTLESVVLGEVGPRALFSRRGAGGARPDTPTVGEAVTLLSLVLLLLFYGSVLLRDLPLLALVHATQWLFLLAPTVALVLVLRLDVRRTFALRVPPGWAVASAALVGSGLWYAALRVIEGAAGDFLPVPSPEIEELGRAFVELGRSPETAALLLLGAAVAPAIAEEALFRGVLLGALLQRVSATSAVLVQASVFALYHLNLAQAPTTFVVGLVLGALVVLSRSLWPAMLLHLLHNGLALSAQLWLPEETLHHPAMHALLLLPVAGLVLLSSQRLPRETGEMATAGSQRGGRLAR